MFFGKSRNLLGLDIGSSAVKLVEFKDLGKGKGYQLKSFGIEPLPAEAIVGGTIMDSGTVVNAITKLIGDQSIKNLSVATAVDGNSVIVKRISMMAMSEAELSEAIQWEAGQYIPFDIEEVKIDYQELEIDPESGNLNVLLVAVKRDLIAEYTALLSQSGLNPSVLDIDSFCVQNAYEINYPISADEVTALVNVGAGSTNISVMKGSKPLFWRDVQSGGNNYTDSLQRELNLSSEQAEMVKRGEEVDGVQLEKVTPVMNAQTEEFGAELKKTLDFFRVSTGEDTINKIVLSGGGSQVTNLDKYCSQLFSVPVEVMNPLQNITIDEREFKVDDISRMAPHFAVAVGLALRNMGD